MSEEDSATGPALTHFLIGHDPAQKFLATAWQSGKLAHGWLLCGSAGIGKATLAYRFARAILTGAMEEGGAALPGFDLPASIPDVSPENQTASLIAAGAHPNLKVIRRTVHPRTGKMRGETVIDDVREAMKFLHTTAMDGGWRIVIVDPIDDLNRNAANALLKALEEPPERCLFLLVNHVPGSVLPTIRSRCQVLNLNSLTAADLSDVIHRVEPNVDETALADVLPLADGSPGRALELLAADAPKLDRQISAIFKANDSACTIKALDLAEQVSRQNATIAFQTVGVLLSRRAAALAREEIAKERQEAAAALWFDIGEQFRRTERLNLDRRHTVMRACLDARKIAAGAP